MDTKTKKELRILEKIKSRLKNFRPPEYKNDLKRKRGVK